MERSAHPGAGRVVLGTTRRSAAAPGMLGSLADVLTWERSQQTETAILSARPRAERRRSL